MKIKATLCSSDSLTSVHIHASHDLLHIPAGRERILGKFDDGKRQILSGRNVTDARLVVGHGKVKQNQARL